MKAFRVLCYVGGGLALLFAVLGYFIGLILSNISDALPVEGAAPEPLRPLYPIFLIPVLLSAIGGGLGIAGGLIAACKKTFALIFSIAAAALCVWTIIGVIPMILFIIAAAQTASPWWKETDDAEQKSGEKKRLLRAASVLGIIAGTMAIILSVFSIFSGAAGLNSYIYLVGGSDSGMLTLMGGIFGLLGGSLGVIGAVTIEKKTKHAGWMMIAAAVICIVLSHYVLAVMLGIGAAFVFWAGVIGKQMIPGPEE